MSWVPFLVGKRSCLGKTFLELEARIVSPSLLWKFDFEFVDKTHETYKPPNNATVIVEPVVMVKIKTRKE
jgi:cytochrome P450